MNSPRVRNIDLIEHLDNSDVLMEVNVVDSNVVVMYADARGADHELVLDRELAGTFGEFLFNHLSTYDRRAVWELGQLLMEGAWKIAEAEGTNT